VERRHVLAEVSIHYDVRWVSEYLSGNCVGADFSRIWAMGILVKAA
jgi:hypothetical protein